MKIKTNILWTLLIAALVFHCGGKSENSGEEASNTSNQGSKSYNAFARYSVAAYKTPGTPKKGDWVATLTKGESIKVLGMEKVNDGKTDVEYLKVEIPGVNSDAWIASSHIVEMMGVLMGEKPMIYARPSVLSPLSSSNDKAMVGLVVEVINPVSDNDGNEWFEIRGKSGENWFKGYVEKSLISFAMNDMRDSLMLERAINTVNSDKSSESDIGKAHDTIREYSLREDAIGRLANSHHPDRNL